MSLLKTQNLSKYFDGIRAVDGVDIRVDRGELVGLIGPNGSGKTTLVNVISGIYKPNSGKVYLDEEDITGIDPWEIYKKGAVRSFQIPRLFNSMLVFENVMLSFRKQRGENPLIAPFKRFWERQERKLAQEALQILSELEISHVALNWTSALSGGQMKLVEMSRSLASQPKIFLLDEPVAGVAPKLATKIFDDITGLSDEGGITFLIIEHRLDILFDYVERILVMDKGKIIFDGSPEDVYDNKRVVRAYLGEV